MTADNPGAPIPCPICPSGAMSHGLKRVLSGPLVLIGWLLFIIPSIACFVVGGLAVTGAVNVADHLDAESRPPQRWPVRAGETDIDRVLREMAEERTHREEQSERAAVQTAINALAGAAFGWLGVWLLGAAIPLLVVGLLLTIKTPVLQCRTCLATVSAAWW